MAAITQQNVNKLNAGLAKAAVKLGTLHKIYRPGTNGNIHSQPLDSGNLLRQQLASFSRNYTYLTPLSDRVADRVGVLDLTLIKAGDYIVSTVDNTIYFVAALPVLQPATCYVCNSLISLRTVDGVDISNLVGKKPYSDKTEANTSIVESNWPASILFAGRGRASLADLPGDSMSAQYTLLLPPNFPTTLAVNSIIESSDGNKYLISSLQKGINFKCLITSIEQ